MWNTYIEKCICTKTTKTHKQDTIRGPFFPSYGSSIVLQLRLLSAPTQGPQLLPPFHPRHPLMLPLQ